MEIKIRIIVPDDYNESSVKLSAGAPLEIIRKSDLIKEFSDVSDEEFKKTLIDALERRFGYFGREEKINEIVQIAYNLKLKK